MSSTAGRKRKARAPVKITSTVPLLANPAPAAQRARNTPSEDVLEGGGYVFSKQSVVLVLQDLECAVCKDIQGEEVVRSRCANSQCTVINYICKKHTEGPSTLNQNRCLMCQTPGVIYDPDKAVTRLLSSVFVDCPKEGCPTKLTASQLKQHLERECEKNVIKCRKPGCDLWYTQKASEDHAVDCRSRKCINRIEDRELGSFGCMWEGNVVDLPNHDCLLPGESYNVLEDLLYSARDRISDIIQEVWKWQENAWDAEAGPTGPMRRPPAHLRYEDGGYYSVLQ